MCSHEQSCAQWWMIFHEMIEMTGELHLDINIQYPKPKTKNNKTTNPHEDLLEFLNNRFDRDYVEPNVACFFSLQTVAAHGLNLPGSMSGSASWKVHCRRFLCQNSVKQYANVWNHRIPWWRFWNHMKLMKLVTSWAPNLERSSSISPSRTSRPQLLLWRCSVLIFVHWFDDFTPWPLPKGAEYKVHRYFLEAFEQVPKHLGNPR